MANTSLVQKIGGSWETSVRTHAVAVGLLVLPITLWIVNLLTVSQSVRLFVLVDVHPM